MIQFALLRLDVIIITNACDNVNSICDDCLLIFSQQLYALVILGYIALYTSFSTVFGDNMDYKAYLLYAEKLIAELKVKYDI